MNSILVVEKLKKYANLKRDVELATFLDIAPTTLSSWKNRQTLDLELIMKKFPNINLNWLLSDEDIPMPVDPYKKIEILEKQLLEKDNEIKKIDGNIRDSQNEYSAIIQSVPNDAIKEINWLRQQLSDAMTVIRNLSSNKA